MGTREWWAAGVAALAIASAGVTEAAAMTVTVTPVGQNPAVTWTVAPHGLSGRLSTDDTSNDANVLVTFSGLNEHGANDLFYKPDLAAAGPLLAHVNILAGTNYPFGPNGQPPFVGGYVMFTYEGAPIEIADQTIHAGVDLFSLGFYTWTDENTYEGTSTVIVHGDAFGSALFGDGGGFFTNGKIDLTSNVMGVQGPQFANLTSATFEADLPEPAMWTLFIAGIGFIGASLRRRGALAAC